MSSMSRLKNPLLLGFEELDWLANQLEKGLTRSIGGGYPPFNIERFTKENGELGLRIVLAVAGFDVKNLDVSVDGDQLTISGRHEDTGLSEQTREFMHRGIANRQFKRVFELVDGMIVDTAGLENGLLAINLSKPTTDRAIKKIKISKAH